MLNLLNRQRTVEFHVKWVRTLLLRAIEESGINDTTEVTVAFVSDSRIRELNRQWRGIDAPTDCLSFPLQSDEPDPFTDDYLGDIVISVQTAARQASLYFPEHHPKDALVLEITVLFVHSLLHLLGYDHQDKVQQTAMSNKEQAILASLFPNMPLAPLTRR